MNRQQLCRELVAREIVQLPSGGRTGCRVLRTNCAEWRSSKKKPRGRPVRQSGTSGAGIFSGAGVCCHGSSSSRRLAGRSTKSFQNGIGNREPDSRRVFVFSAEFVLSSLTPCACVRARRSNARANIPCRIKMKQDTSLQLDFFSKKSSRIGTGPSVPKRMQTLESRGVK